jgi:ankyrin repeat protein
LILLAASVFAIPPFVSGCGQRLPEKQSKELQLFRAASDGDERKVGLLLDRGLSVDTREAEGETPLMYAAENGQTEMVEVLLKRGATVNAVSDNGETALVRAAQACRATSARVLLERGANANLGTPLIRASSVGCPATVKVLLEKGADPNAELFDGNTALTAAVIQSGSKEIVAELIAGGADVKHQNKQGKTAEMLAIERNYSDLAPLLRQDGLHGSK